MGRVPYRSTVPTPVAARKEPAKVRINECLCFQRLPVEQINPCWFLNMPIASRRRRTLPGATL
jgi:hypothetical protein